MRGLSMPKVFAARAPSTGPAELRPAPEQLPWRLAGGTSTLVDVDVFEAEGALAGAGMMDVGGA